MKSLSEIKANNLFRDVRIYRIFGIERLFQLINEETLALLAPRKWEDPYEKALQDLLETKNKFKIYGLCWSSRSRSDALWRIYSPNKLGVRVSTTIGRVIDSIRDSHEFNNDNLFVGAVSYLPETTRYHDKLFDFGKNKLSLSAEDFSRPIVTMSDAIKDMIKDKEAQHRRKAEDIAKIFLVKRKAFDHESEVRFIYVDRNNVNNMDGVLKIKIDPVKLISAIQFDPRMKDDIYNSLKKALLANVAAGNIRISKSDLYKSPEEIISTS